MSKAPSVLLLDDGELDRTRRLLERIGTDFVHLSGDEIGAVVDEPADLLITTGKRALEMPSFDPSTRPSDDTSDTASRPTWICIHGDDVSELRERLRSIGVHFLVHSALDQTTLQLLLEKMLCRQAERRRAAGLPMGTEIAYRIGNELYKGRLAELSRKSCRILTVDEIFKGTRLWVYLPRELTSDQKIGFPGRVESVGPHESRPGVHWRASVILFEDLDEDAAAHLEEILSGTNPGTRVTPLDGPPPLDEVELTHRDRRQHTRHLYQRRMALLGGAGVKVPQVMFGRDLSVNGLRIERHQGLRVGMRIAVALYGDARTEPIVVQADVVSDNDNRGLGLKFHRVTQEQRRRLDGFVADLPPLEEICSSSGESGPIVMSKLLSSTSDGSDEQYGAPGPVDPDPSSSTD